eukprot:TRINITY_DN19845_c0_g1_i1.p1 TRINITY_DN19845_c0_g1~~TRINITY_DN19845_c0_g1_i1.p1  ORF type:complete len:2256 (+),score=541.97 TRINITY_DN19845_c0_g1_i1:58-6825(+)
MPRILCYGKNDKKNGERVGSTVAYKVAGVYGTARARYKAVLLPFSPKPDEDLGQVDLVVDGALDVSKRAAGFEDPSFQKVMEAFVDRIQNRHNNTLVVHGLRGTGKTQIIQDMIPYILESVRKHIDTSGREAKSRRDQVRQQQHQEQLLLKKEQEQQEQVRLQAKLKSAELRAVAAYTDSVFPQVPTPKSRSRASSASLESPRRGRKESVTDKQKMLDEIDRRFNTLEQKGLIHTPTPPIDSPKNSEKLSPVHPAPPKLSPRAPSRPACQRQVSFTSKVQEEECNLESFKGQARNQSMEHDLSRRSSVEAVPTRKPEAGGRFGPSPTLIFDSEKETHVVMPPIDDLSNTVSQAMVECWLRTTVTDRKMALLDVSDVEGGCKLAIHLNANTYDELSPGVIRLQVRDGLHKSVEGHVLYDGLFNGDWHLLQCHVVNARDNKLDIRIDGMQMRLFTNSQSDEPFAFTSWNQHGVLGAERTGPTPTSSLTSFFDGSIAEFRAWDMSYVPRRALSRLSLNEGNNTEVKDALTFETGTVYNGEWEAVPFPPTAIRLSGFSAINVGTLGDFGAKMTTFGIELWMRTTEKNRPMSLLKVTDSQKKHMALGITVNHNGKTAQSNTVTFTLRDAVGTELVCVWQPPVVSELTDGLWHNIQWKVSDSTTNSCFVKVDGKVMDVKYLARGGPSNFLPFKDYLAIGSHNNRGRIEECFEGMLRHVVLSADDHIVGVWDLNEGPGARLALDSGDPLSQSQDEGTHSGLNHGFYIMIHAANAPKPHKHWTEWIRCELPDVETTAGALKQQQDKKELAKWATNTVRVACLAVEPVPKPNSNVFIERLRDVRHDEVITLCPPTPSAFRMNERYGDKASLFERLPDTAWDLLDTTDQVLQYFMETMEIVEAKGTAKGHHIWILNIGDAVSTFVDLAGVAQPQSAVYDSRTNRWFSATTSIGTAAKSAACLNRGSAAVTECFTEVGSYPMLWLRNTEHPIPFTKWEDSYVTRILRTYGIVETDEWSHMYFLHATAPEKLLSSVELCYGKSTLEAIGDSSQKMAANSLQKLVMRARAKTHSRALKRQLIELTVKRKKSQSLLQEYPSAGVKLKKVALIIASWKPQDTKLLPACETVDNANRVADVMGRLGYEVVMMLSGDEDKKMVPTVQNVLLKIQEVCDDDTMLMVYVSARSGGDDYHKPPLMVPPKMWLQEEEEEIRDELLETEEDDRVTLLSKEHQDRLKRKSPRQSSALPSVMNREMAPRTARAKSSGTRLVAGSGGAGKMKRHQIVAGKDKNKDEPEDIVIVHAKERALALQDEAMARGVLDELELKHRNQIMAVRQEVHARERNCPQAGNYLLLDNTPYEASPLNSLTLQQLSNAVIPQSITVGIHRLLVVDTCGWKSRGGWYSVQASSGEQLQGDYGIEAHCSFTPYLLEGLCGSAQPRDGPLVLEEERAKITLAALVEYLARTIKPGIGIKSNILNCEGKLVGDAVVCPTILRTPEKAEEEARVARDPKTVYQTMRQFWTTLSLPPSYDSCSDEEKLQMRNSLSKAGEGHVEHLMTYHCPYVTIVFDTALENLRASTIEAIKKDAQEVSGEEVECIISSAPLWSDKEEGFSMKKNETACVRLVLKGIDVGDLRWTMPATVNRREHDTTFRFVHAMRRKFMKDTALYGFGSTGRANSPKALAMRYHLFIRWQAPSPVVCAIVHCGRRGGLRKYYARNFHVDEIGAFAPQETAAFERKVTSELEKHRLSVSEKRKKQQAENKALRMKERNLRATAEATERIQSKLAKIRESEKNIAAPDIKIIYSLQDGGLMSEACNVLFMHTSVPYLTPGRPGLTPSMHAPKGIRYVKQLVDWGLWDVLKAALEAGTGNDEGEDDPSACGAILKVVCGSVVLCKQQFMEHGLVSAVLRVVQRHSSFPEVVRWGLGIVMECTEVKNTGSKRTTRLLGGYETLNLALHCWTLTANRRDAASLASILTAALHSMSKTSEEGVIFNATRLAVYTLLAAGNPTAFAHSDLDTDQAGAVQVVTKMAFEILLLALELQPVLVEREIFENPVLVGKSPFDAPVSPPQMSGPGVMVCSQCGDRYTRTAEGDCESSTLESKKHAGPPADGELHLLPNMEDYKEKGERAGILKIIEQGLAGSNADPSTVAVGGKLLNHVLHPDTKLGAKLLQHLLRVNGACVVAFIGLCLSDTCRGASGELPAKVQAELVNTLGTLISESSPEDLQASEIGQYLKPKAIYIKRVMPTAGTREFDLSTVDVIRHALDSL